MTASFQHQQHSKLNTNQEASLGLWLLVPYTKLSYGSKRYWIKALICEFGDIVIVNSIIDLGSLYLESVETAE